MEGFVFDLQRFAYNWPTVLNNLSGGGITYYEARRSTDTYSIFSAIGYAENDPQFDYIKVLGTSDGSCTISVRPKGSYYESDKIILDFSGAALSKKINITISQTRVGLTSVPNNAYITLQEWSTVDLSTINAGATVSRNGCVFSGTQNNSSFFIGESNATAITLYSGGFALDATEVYKAYGDITVCGLGTVACYGNRSITVEKRDNGDNNIGLVNSEGSTTTVTLKKDAKVNLGTTSYTSLDNSSTLVASGSAANVSVTLTAGVFKASNTEFTLNSGVQVQQGEGTSAVLYTAKETGSKCKLDGGVMTLTAGKFETNGTSSVQVGSTTYTANSATIAISGEGNNKKATLSAGTVTLDQDEDITVSGNNATSIIKAKSGSVDVSVSGGTYTISKLNSGDIVTIDNVEYTYTYDTNGGRLMNGDVGWKIDNNSNFPHRKY